MLRRSGWWLGGLATLVCFPGGGSNARAQQGPEPGALEKLDARYAARFVELTRERVRDLAALAPTLPIPEAERAYAEVFRATLAHNLYSEAEPAARQFLGANIGPAREKTLATFITLVAEADRGEYDRSLAELEAYLKARPPHPAQKERLDRETILAISEAYLQRLVRAGRYEVARRVCELGIANAADPEVKDHFRSRLARLAMVGKPAPAIEQSDVDGKPVRLADLKGKVVLIDFWATWCPPCVASVPRLKELAAKYGESGLVILGVNVDSARVEGDAPRDVVPGVTQFLLDHRVTWPCVVGGSGPNSPVERYGVREIPANFLVDREGRIIQVEQDADSLERAIAGALGLPASKP